MLPYLEYIVNEDGDGRIFLPTTSMAMLPNMILSIVTYLSPRHQAFLRSAGMKGLLIFTQLAEDGAVPLCVDATGLDLHLRPQLIPFAPIPHYLGLPKHEALDILFRCSPVVISHSAMVARGFKSPMDVLLGYTVRLVRYHFDLSVKEVGSHSPSEPRYAMPLFSDKTFGVEEVHVSGCECLSTIHHSFLACLSTLVEVDISPLQHVTSIGNYFMYQCDSIDPEKGVDLSPFRNVTTIGDYFLEDCSALTIDISPMTSLFRIGTGFLARCHNAKEIRFGSAFANLHTIPSEFLLGCKSLTSIDTSPFRNVTAIGGLFMADCPLLTTINLEPFENVTTIGLKFLYRCSGLLRIDVSLLKRVTCVGRDFLTGCTALHRGTRDRYCSVADLPDVSPGDGVGSGDISLKEAVLTWENGDGRPGRTPASQYRYLSSRDRVFGIFSSDDECVSIEEEV